MIKTSIHATGHEFFNLSSILPIHLSIHLYVNIYMRRCLSIHFVSICSPLCH